MNEAATTGSATIYSSQLTANNRKLRFDPQQRDTGNWYYAEYSTFRVLSEADNYTLQVDGFAGNASYDQ